MGGYLTCLASRKIPLCARCYISKMGNELLDHLQNHVVPVYVEFERGPRLEHRMFTAFVFSVSNEWYLLTAGHCIQAVEENLQVGWTVRRCLMLDGLRATSRYREPIPINWRDSLASNIGANKHADYGLMFLSALQRRALEANNVLAFAEPSWDRDQEEGDSFKVVGFPSELSELGRFDVKVSATLQAVREIHSRPDCFEETNVPMFYGEVFMPDPTQLGDIDGISGGPILALQPIPNGFRYRLHAVQSAWDKPSRRIYAPLVRPLGLLLRQLQKGTDLRDLQSSPR